MTMEPRCVVEVATRKEMINYHNQLVDASNHNGKILRAVCGLFTAYAFLDWLHDKVVNERISELEKEIGRLKDEKEEE